VYHGNKVGLDYLRIKLNKLFTVGQKWPKAWMASSVKYLWISFELLGRFS
jgi:hypothetical protein